MLCVYLACSSKWKRSDGVGSTGKFTKMYVRVVCDSDSTAAADKRKRSDVGSDWKWSDTVGSTWKSSQKSQIIHKESSPGGRLVPTPELNHGRGLILEFSSFNHDIGRQFLQIRHFIISSVLFLIHIGELWGWLRQECVRKHIYNSLSQVTEWIRRIYYSCELFLNNSH